MRSLSRRKNTFLSTLSLRRATQNVLQNQLRHGISIHALLAESDSKRRKNNHDRLKFLSTLSLRRATPTVSKVSFHQMISIHALLAESDIWPFSLSPVCKLFLSTLSLRRATGCRPCAIIAPTDFYPRSPCGERPVHLAVLAVREGISIHALLAESDMLRFLL